jgi:hypothetical protein
LFRPAAEPVRATMVALTSVHTATSSSRDENNTVNGRASGGGERRRAPAIKSAKARRDDHKGDDPRWRLNAPPRSIQLSRQSREPAAWRRLKACMTARATGLPERSRNDPPGALRDHDDGSKFGELVPVPPRSAFQEVRGSGHEPPWRSGGLEAKKGTIAHLGGGEARSSSPKPASST